MGVLRGLMNALSASNGTETAQMGHGDHLGMHLGIGGAKCGVEVMDNIGHPVDMFIGPMDILRIDMDVNTTSDKAEIIRTNRNEKKSPDLNWRCKMRHQGDGQCHKPSGCIAKQYIDQLLVLNLLELFDSKESLRM